MPAGEDEGKPSIVERVERAIHRRESVSEAEIEAEAADEQPDPITRREAFEEELMDEGRSAVGEVVELDRDPPTG